MEEILQTHSPTGLPDFSWYNIPKREKLNLMTTKYAQWPKCILP
jgi:hypothetical protein